MDLANRGTTPCTANHNVEYTYKNGFSQTLLMINLCKKAFSREISTYSSPILRCSSFFFGVLDFRFLLRPLDGYSKILTGALDVLQELARPCSCGFIAFFELFELALECFELLF